jgi:hypothetical protein
VEVLDADGAAAVQPVEAGVGTRMQEAIERVGRQLQLVTSEVGDPVKRADMAKIDS